MLSHYIAIGLGGATGAIARVAFAKALPASLMGIPAQIIIVNVVGCFLMGFITQFMGSFWSLPDHLKYFLISGFLGGFTTFSAFALEFGVLYQRHAYVSVIAYVMLSVGFSFMAFLWGMRVVKVFA